MDWNKMAGIRKKFQRAKRLFLQELEEQIRELNDNQIYRCSWDDQDQDLDDQEDWEGQNWYDREDQDWYSDQDWYGDWGLDDWDDDWDGWDDRDAGFPVGCHVKDSLGNLYLKTEDGKFVNLLTGRYGLEGFDLQLVFVF
jgi:hypothetical protein